MRLIFKLFIPFLLVFSMNEKKYSFKTDRFYSSIVLDDNNNFYYTIRNEIGKVDSHGTYFLKGDSLILNSSPQRDKLIVQEFFKKNKRTSSIKVLDKEGNNIIYHINLIFKDGTTLYLKNQYNKTVIKNHNINSFYLIDTKGLKSPVYNIKGLYSNEINIIFETNRVFDNEVWYINNDSIKPIGLDGKFQNYFLIKDF